MKILTYVCDWCSVAQRSPKDEDWPDGWSKLDAFGTEDLLCDACVRAGKEAVKTAIAAAKAARALGRASAVAKTCAACGADSRNGRYCIECDMSGRSREHAAARPSNAGEKT